MFSVVSYGCATAAGDSVEELWTTLQTGEDHSTPQAFLFKNRGNGTDLDLLTRKLAISFRDMATRADANRLKPGQFGVILASTKGCTQDIVSGAEIHAVDPLTPLLDSALRALELQPARSVVVSNACSSGLAAARLAQMWIRQGLNDVLILAADAASDFVRKGFQSLKLISTERPKPFAANRSGFLLGEATACVWLSGDARDGISTLHQVGLDSEGSAVTRPTMSGESVIRAAQNIRAQTVREPDLILAHGTGTIINDQTEDLAFSRLFGKKPVVTGSKWAIGHTLGASGAIDIILASEILRRQQTFSLRTTENPDPKFECRYLLPNMNIPEPKRVMVSSLGFGGMHASCFLEARS